MSIQSDVFNACYKYIAMSSGKPYILVITQAMTTDELKAFANTDGSLILDISMSSLKNFSVNDSDISFSLTFRGQVVHTAIPYSAIFSIYDQTDPTVGMAVTYAFPTVAAASPPPPKPLTRKPPHLSLVKN